MLRATRDVNDSGAGEEPPIADYDHMTVRAVEGCARSLTYEQLTAVRDYECAHQARTPVIRLLTARLRAIRDERSAEERSGGYGPAPRSSLPGRHLGGAEP